MKSGNTRRFQLNNISNRNDERFSQGSIMDKQSLIYIPRKKAGARFRLFCFPYAGGSSSIYSSWVNNIHADVELALIQLPGRGLRFGEAPYQTMDALVSHIFIALNKLSPKQSIFYGHSMGARVAYEVALMLYLNQLCLPVYMIASASSAPSVERRVAMSYNLPDPEFINHLRALKGTPEEVLLNDDLMELMLPTLRADFKILETYRIKNRCALPTKIRVFAGKSDDISMADLDAWPSLFESNAGIYWFDGGHFFINENNAEVLRVVNREIETILGAELDNKIKVPS
jgi:medium-chain acyl-[acyl-carrier-protein] hydrolase